MGWEQIAAAILSAGQAQQDKNKAGVGNIRPVDFGQGISKVPPVSNSGISGFMSQLMQGLNLAKKPPISTESMNSSASNIGGNIR